MNQPTPEQSTNSVEETRTPPPQRRSRIALYLVLAVVLFIVWSTFRHYYLERQFEAAVNATLEENPWGIEAGMPIEEAMARLPPAGPPLPKDEIPVPYLEYRLGGARGIFSRQHYFLIGRHRLFLSLQVADPDDRETVYELAIYSNGTRDAWYIRWLSSLIQ